MTLARYVVPMFLVVVSVFGCFSPVLASDLKITEMAVTTKIVKGNPIDAVRRISSRSVPALYCFTRLTGGDQESSIKHVWYKDGIKVAEYELPVKGERWRTYSKKTLDRQSAGEWRVDAVADDGAVLKSVSFRIN